MVAAHAVHGPPSNTPILFYSRTIGLFEYAEDENTAVPLLAGGRLTGRTGAYTVGALNIQQRADEALGAPSTNFSVLRLKRDILKQSSVGVIVTNRSQSVYADGSNQTLGADASFTFRRYLTINTYLARTRTESWQGNDASYRGDVQWTGDRYGFEAEHLVVERNFNPEVGFLRREDFRRNFGMFRFSPRPAGPSPIRKYQFETSVDHFTDTNGRLETQLASVQAGMDLQNGDEWRVAFRNNYEYLDEPLTDADDRARHVAHVRDVVKCGGTLVIGTFAPDGPERCSGLPVCRYDAAGIGVELGGGFTLVETVTAHRTPTGAVQSWRYSRFVRHA